MEAQKPIFDLYVPMDRRQALINGEPLPESVHGAVLFADISGFTPLTITLSGELGPKRGAEELTRMLNHVYTDLVAEVHRYRGSVIGFSGDAITCWFDGDDGERGTTCALAMQEIMTHLTTVGTFTGKHIMLGIKVAVAVGSARRFVVGDPRIQFNETLTGAVLNRVALAEHLIQRGEIIVGKEVEERLGGQLLVQEWRSDPGGEAFAVIIGLTRPAQPDPWPVIPALDPEVARDWILPPIYKRLRDGQSEFLTELRPAVALFLRFSGIDYDHDDEARNKLDTFIRRVQTILAHYEGYLGQLTIGDKGSYLFAFFGAPVAHEDDAERAVAAALELREISTQFEFIEPVQIGVTHGQVRAGAYGGASRRVYGIQGTEVNLAARLMSHAAPGQILVSPRIAEAVPTYEFQLLPLTAIKGVEKALTPYALLGLKESGVEVSRLQPIVGRAAERAVLTECLQALLDPQKERKYHTIVIEGEAGIGKSRLAADLIEQAKSLGIPVFVGAGDAIEQNTAYFPWRTVFGKVLGLEGLDAIPVMKERVNMQLQQDSYLVERASLLNDVLPFIFPDNELTTQMTGEARAKSTRDVLVRVLHLALPNMSEQPPLLILEDSHWLDSSSWALSAQIRREFPSWLLVIVTRPMLADAGGTIPDEYKRFVDAEDTYPLRLTTLPYDEISALVAQRLEVTQIPEPVSTLIHQRAEGHPFFSEEIAYALRDAGLIQIQKGEVVMSPAVRNLSTLDFPETIQGVITSRVDRLPPTQQLTLKIASVLGRIFLFNILREIYPVPTAKPQLKEQLSVLERLDITPIETLEPDLSYIFKHIITQEVVYGLMTFAQRKQLHRTVAEFYEQIYAGDMTRYYPLLAHHWSKAEDTAKAIYYLEKAGDQSLNSFANREAAQFFSEAIQLADPHRIDRLRMAQWHKKLGQAYLGLGRLQEARIKFHEALGLLEERVPKTTVSMIGSLLNQLGRQALHRLFPQYIQNTRFSKEKTEVFLEISRIYLLLATVLYLIYDPLPMFYSVIANLNIAERLDDTPELAYVYSQMSAISGFIPIHSLAKLYGNLSIKLADRFNHVGYFVSSTIAISTYESGIAGWKDLKPRLERVVEICEELGDNRQRGEALSFMATNAILEGDREEAERISHILYEHALRSENPVQRIWALQWLGAAALQAGNAQKAIELMVEALAIHGDSEDLVRDITVKGILAFAKWMVGEKEAAFQLAAYTANRIAKATIVDYSIYLGYFYSTEVILKQLEQKQTTDPLAESTKGNERLAKQAVKNLKSYARVFPVGEPGYLRARGLYEWHHGKPGRAIASWEKALQVARALPMHYEAQLAQNELDRHRPS